jgi:hypothetical protein
MRPWSHVVNVYFVHPAPAQGGDPVRIRHVRRLRRHGHGRSALVGWADDMTGALTIVGVALTRFALLGPITSMPVMGEERKQVLRMQDKL